MSTAPLDVTAAICALPAQVADNTAELAGLKELVRQVLDRIAGITPADSNSPVLKGDNAAAALAGFKSRPAFKHWAKTNRIKPRWHEGRKYWNRAEILNACKGNPETERLAVMCTNLTRANAARANKTKTKKTEAAPAQ